MNIELAYNPYLLETTMLIDGEDVSSSETYGSFAEVVNSRIPLQSWLGEAGAWNGLAAELYEKGQSEGEIRIQFSGRELDFQDMRASFSHYEANNPDARGIFQYETKFIFDDRQTAAMVDQLVNELKGPRFAGLVERYGEYATPELKSAYADLDKDYHAAQGREFNIVFAGLYSSGKSTLLNALIGKNLLPMANGTCTSKVFRIRHEKGLRKVKMCCVAKGEDGEEKIIVPMREFQDEIALQKAFTEIFPAGEDGKLLPSNPPDITEVHLYTDLAHLYPKGFEDKFNLVLVDTPGTNSGAGNAEEGNNRHLDITLNAITSKDKDMVVLIAEGTKFEDESIVTLLKEIDSTQDDDNGAYDQRFLFVLNKCDTASYANSESIESSIGQYRNYITRGRAALKLPRIFPAAAQVALAVKLGLVSPERVRSKEENALYQNYESFGSKCRNKFSAEDYSLEKYASVSETIKDEMICRLENMDAPGSAFIHSGVPALEMAIRDYIERYAYPLKVQAVMKTFQSILTEMMSLTSKMEADIQEEIKKAKIWEDSKNREESESEVIKSQKKRMEKTKAIISNCISKIEDQKFYDEEIAALRIKVSRSVFAPLQNRLTDCRGFDSSYEAQAEQQRILDEFKKGTAVINSELDAVGKDLTQRVKEILKLIENAVADLKSEDIFNFGGFDFTQSVSFSRLAQSDLSVGISSKKISSTRKNPVKDIHYPWYRVVKKISQKFAPEFIKSEKSVFYLDISGIKESLTSLEADYNDHFHKVRAECKAYIESQKKSAIDWARELQRALEDTEQRLLVMSENIRSLCKNQEETENFVHKLEDDCKYIEYDLKNRLESVGGLKHV